MVPTKWCLHAAAFYNCLARRMCLCLVARSCDVVNQTQIRCIGYRSVVALSSRMFQIISDVWHHYWSDTSLLICMKPHLNYEKCVCQSHMEGDELMKSTPSFLAQLVRTVASVSAGFVSLQEAPTFAAPTAAENIFLSFIALCKNRTSTQNRLCRTYQSIITDYSLTKE